MEVRIKLLDTNVMLTYNEGYLEHITNIDTGTKMVMEVMQEGSGFTIKEERMMIFGPSNVCDARYVRIIDLDVFVPKFLFINNIKK
jgi:hypothetical protein